MINQIKKLAVSYIFGTSEKQEIKMLHVVKIELLLIAKAAFYS